MSDITKLGVSNFCMAFLEDTVGTKVTDATQFMSYAGVAIANIDFATQEVPGQAFILESNITPFISSGEGEHTQDPNDYVVRPYRGRVELCLKREKAAKVEGTALIVYTREAYLADSDVLKNPVEIARIETSEYTHVLVAILDAHVDSALSAYYSTHELNGRKKTSSAYYRYEKPKGRPYHDKWCTVAG